MATEIIAVSIELRKDIRESARQRTLNIDVARGET